MDTVAARMWTDITTYHMLSPFDMSVANEIFEIDAHLFTQYPTEVPTLAPSISPTQLPSVSPTDSPSTRPSLSRMPSVSPTRSPTRAPSALPTVTDSQQPTQAPITPAPTPEPTDYPTMSPTRDPYPPNDVPPNPDTSFFNYDLDSPYGPGHPEVVRHNSTTNKVVYQNNGWLNWVPPDDYYWREFDQNGGFGAWSGVLANRMLDRNRCGRVGLQSPIDVRDSGAVCYEHHQIRVRVRTTHTRVPTHPLMHFSHSCSCISFVCCCSGCRGGITN